ncbi:MAG: flagellar assembly protein FliW [Vampirovibrionales bacterium]
MASTTIQTSRFGPITVDDAGILSFVSPILGFDELTDYVLLDHADDSPFKWLQSLQAPELAFVVTNPKFFNIDYEFELPEDFCQLLELTQAEDAVVLTIVNIPADNPKAMTANLLGPVVVNQSNRKAMQVVLSDVPLAPKPLYSPKNRQRPQTGGCFWPQCS